jgi:hypothetical protein
MDVGGKTGRAVKLRRVLRVAYPVAYVVFCIVLFLVAWV